jgi:hypothetical protein
MRHAISCAVNSYNDWILDDHELQHKRCKILQRQE